LAVLYDGSGFAKDYNEARGHLYTLTDINETLRPHGFANCLTCKSPELIAILNSEGVGTYSTEFAAVYERIDEPVSCYSCHANTGDELVVSSPFLISALGSDQAQVPVSDQVCGQCHIEYYFAADDKSVVLPWRGSAQMNPDAILAYYNEMGFADFTNGISGAAMIKIQHPEFETVTGTANKMQVMGALTCPDCHMPVTANAQGEPYRSHNWLSPLAQADLLKDACQRCHPDMQKLVNDIQTNVKMRQVSIGSDLANLHVLIGQAAADGSKTDAEITELRQIVRDAQFYWDFCFVENSDGAHNSTFANSLLDKAEELVNEGLAKFDR